LCSSILHGIWFCLFARAIGRQESYCVYLCLFSCPEHSCWNIFFFLKRKSQRVVSLWFRFQSPQGLTP
jgi:hypothetical protein